MEIKLKRYFFPEKKKRKTAANAISSILGEKAFLTLPPPFISLLFDPSSISLENFKRKIGRG